MNPFIYECPVKVYFGKGCVEAYLKDELSKVGSYCLELWQRNLRLALSGIEALEKFIKEIGLPATFTELGIPENTDFRAIADSTNITAGCSKKLTPDEIYEILLECK